MKERIETLLLLSAGFSESSQHSRSPSRVGFDFIIRGVGSGEQEMRLFLTGAYF